MDAPIDEIIGPEAFFRRQLAGGRFMIQRCRTSGRFFFFPRICEPGTGDLDLEWTEASGRGTVYSTTFIHDPRGVVADFNIALIDLKEGPRLLSRVVNVDPRTVTIGMPVRAVVTPIVDEPLVVFEPEKANDDVRP